MLLLAVPVAGPGGGRFDGNPDDFVGRVGVRLRPHQFGIGRVGGAGRQPVAQRVKAGYSFGLQLPIRSPAARHLGQRATGAGSGSDWEDMAGEDKGRKSANGRPASCASNSWAAAALPPLPTGSQGVSTPSKSSGSSTRW
uniref:Uncharacterized protein n=1 Tax=Tanacetum cinerariifolium TaxID=118510 RepID=A0A699T1S2_TANCI|nr:hypothetical protein [Tanacetum cinerariifolium]